MIYCAYLCQEGLLVPSSGSEEDEEDELFSGEDGTEVVVEVVMSAVEVAATVVEVVLSAEVVAASLAASTASSDSWGMFLMK